MSIASTQIAMDYVGFTKAGDTCGTCAHSQKVPAHGGFPQGLRCTPGGFFVVRRATCKQHSEHMAAPAATARIQVGPTDV